MSEQETTYRLTRGFSITMGVLGYAGLAIAAGVVVFHVLDPNEMEAHAAAIVVVVFGGAGAYGLFIGHSGDRYAIAISSGGIRSLDGRIWLPWSSVTGLRERSWLHRIEIMGASGPTGVTLEYQLEEFESALEAVVARMPRTDRDGDQPRVFAPKRTGLLVLGGIVLFLCGWMWFFVNAASALFLAGIAGAVYAVDHYTGVRRVAVDEREISFVRGARTLELPLGAIEECKLRLRPVGRGRQQLSVAIVAGGTLHWVQPGGTDPFRLHAAISDALERHGAGAASPRGEADGA